MQKQCVGSLPYNRKRLDAKEESSPVVKQKVQCYIWCCINNKKVTI